MADLFGAAASENNYDASNIEVLEGLEPVRHRPGMYIGGTDDRALHHLAAEILDNSMDEAVAGHANRIDITLVSADTLSIRDNGRGMPVGQHPKFPDKSAVEVIMTTLHAGGKFSGKSYATSGGLHGVGASVVNALSSLLTVEIARDKKLYSQTFSRGLPQGNLTEIGSAPNRRGTSVSFTPDTEIFGDKAHFKPATLFRMAKSKAFLFAGVEIRWKCEPALLANDDAVPTEAVLHYPGGLADYLNDATSDKALMVSTPFAELAELDGQKFEWAITWLGGGEDGFFNSYCNTVPTPLGGTHETGFRQAIVRGLRAFGDLSGNRKAADITADDVLANSAAMLSVFLRDPQFQGQTKDKLVSGDATRLTEQAVRDRFDHWLSADAARATFLLEAAIERAEDRKRRKKEKEVARKSATRKLRLPGKLADCTANDTDLTELFLVEGDSAGGSAKQARNRKTQAVLPLRGKILNVASATTEKLSANQELSDLALALGVRPSKDFKLDDLRYGRIIIMTDADVDGAHIRTLMLTFLWRFMKRAIVEGYVYIAQPPLYQISKGRNSKYAFTDEERDKIIEEMKVDNPNAKIGIQRYKGLGEMNPDQLWNTTMNPETRTMLKVTVADAEDSDRMFEILMGEDVPDRRHFIEKHAKEVTNLDI
jgi:topoisomerase-4 subunit B